MKINNEGIVYRRVAGQPFLSEVLCLTNSNMPMPRFLLYLTGTLLLSACLSSCIVGRYVVYNFADIRDHKKFPARDLQRSGPPFTFPAAAKPKAPKSITVKGEALSFDEYLDRNKTVAFIIIQHDSIQYERYFRKYDDASVVPSFSMAKSVTSILVGCAIADGLIGSVSEPVTTYVPELKSAGFETVTIEHLLQMTSGIRFQESYYNPFAGAASYYYGKHLRRKLSRMKLRRPPGGTFEYISGGSQLLGLVLERSLKGKSITTYLQEKLWGPMGMEWDASWSIDQKKGGMEKTFCCLNARARDYAKLGRLYLHKGSWNGRQLVPQSWVAASTRVDTTAGSAWFYQYQWWLPSRTGDFMAQGHLGQYIYVNPAKDMVIVRLGKSGGSANWWEVLTSLAAGY